MRVILIIQEMRSEWDKLARGGDLAVQRANVPSRVIVPSPRANSSWLHQTHAVSFLHGPKDPFTNQRVLEGATLGQRRLTLSASGLRFALKHGEIEVQVISDSRPQPQHGRPVRPSLSGSVLLRLRPNTWSGWVENQRHVGLDTGDWYYSQTHWNIAWLSTFDSGVFVSREPQTHVDYRAQLR